MHVNELAVPGVNAGRVFGHSLIKGLKHVCPIFSAITQY